MLLACRYCTFSLVVFFLQSFFLGTVFREPILCRNIPRIVPGNILFLIVFMKATHPKRISAVTILSYRLEETHLYWQTCLWWSISRDWHYYKRTWKTKNGFWWASSFFFFLYQLHFENINSNENLSWLCVIEPENGDESVELDVYNFKGPGVALAMYNVDEVCQFTNVPTFYEITVCSSTCS